MNYIFFIFVVQSLISLSVSIDTVYLPSVCNSSSSTITTGISLQSSTSLQYSNSLSCYYVVNVPIGYQVLAVFRRYEIEEKLNSVCSDYINFYDGTSTSATGLNTDPYCGTTAPTNVTSTSSSMTFEFVTDSTVSRRGFDLLFTAFSSAPCSGSQYACSNGRCIAKDLECDSYNQCEDNSDESHCTEEDLLGTTPSDNSALIVGLCIGLGSLVLICVLIGVYIYRQYRWKRFLKDPLPIIQQWDRQTNYPLTRKYYKNFNNEPEFTKYNGGSEDRPNTPNSGSQSSKGILKPPHPDFSIA